jgi:hypothetical protein
MLALAGVLSVAAVILVPLGSSVASASGPSTVVQLSAAQLAAAGAPACPNGWDCVGMPCPTPGHCGVVEAGPVSGLGPSQYVYLNFYGFAGSSKLLMWYCRDNGSLSTSPACMDSPTATVPNPYANVLIPASGTLNYSFGVASNDSSGGAPFCGVIPTLRAGQSQLPTKAPCGEVNSSGGSNPPGSPFYCDNNGHNCSIDITEPGLEGHPLQSPDPNNSVVIPVSFETQSTACTSAHTVVAESEFGFDNLFASTDAPTCIAQGSNAYVPSDTNLSGLAAVQALHGGSIQIAFTDDPQSPEEQKILTEDHDLLIPLAISANVIANRSQRYDVNANVEPWTSVKLSANMVAGIITGAYGSSSDADLAPCGASTCPDFTFLNYENGYQPPTSLGAFVRAGDAGATDQTFAWLCASQPLQYTFNFGTISLTSTESMPAEQVLKNGLANSGTLPSGCLDTDDFPSIIPPSIGWTEVSSPDTQALKLAQFVPSAGVSTASAGFADLNWSEAAYYGMSDAALQNASGAFVAPTPASVMAGLGDGSWDENGMWTPNYANSSDAAAYAMPTVMYAVVPRATLPAAEVNALQQTVSSILAVTTNQNASLKDGLLPLPADVAAMANDEAAHGIGNGSYEAPYPHSGGSSSSSSSGTSGYDSSFSSFGSSQNAYGAHGAGSGSGKGHGAGGDGTTPSSSPTYGPFFLTASESRMLIPGIVALGGLLALLGLAMIGSSLLSGKLAGGAAEAGADGAAEAGPAGEGLDEVGEVEP